MASPFETHLQAALDVAFATFGVEALWTPQGGEAVAVTLKPEDGSGEVAFDASGRAVATVRRIYSLRVSEQRALSSGAEPRGGDLVVIDGEQLAIVAKPERRDRRRLVWTLELDR